MAPSATLDALCPSGRMWSIELIRWSLSPPAELCGVGEGGRVPIAVYLPFKWKICLTLGGKGLCPVMGF